MKKEGFLRTKRMVSILLPSVLETTLLGVTAAIETGMTGQFGGDTLAALGLTLQPRLLAAALFTGVHSAVSVIMGRTQKQHRHNSMDFTLLRGILVVVSVLSISCSAIFSLIPEKILILTGGSRLKEEQNVLQFAASYLRAFAIGFPFGMLSQCICAALRGTGNAWKAFLITASGSVTQIGTGMLLLNRMIAQNASGIRFCAIAYTLGAIVMSVFSVHNLLHLIKQNNLMTQTKRNSLPQIRQMLPIAGWVTFEQIALRLGYIISGKLLFGMGTILFAANQVCQQLSSLTYALGDGFASGGTALVASAGRRCDERLKRMSLLVSAAVSVGIACMIFLFSERIAGLFIRPGTEYASDVLGVSVGGLRTFSFFIPFQCAGLMLNGIMRADGKQKSSALISVFATGIIRPILTCAAVRFTTDELWIVWLFTSMDLLLRFILLLRIFLNKKGTQIVCQRISGVPAKNREKR